MPPEDVEDDTPSDASPTLQVTAGEVDDRTSKTRNPLVHEKVMARDNYTCLLTRYVDMGAPFLKNRCGLELNVAYIVKRSVGICDANQGTSESKVASRLYPHCVV